MLSSIFKLLGLRDPRGYENSFNALSYCWRVNACIAAQWVKKEVPWVLPTLTSKAIELLWLEKCCDHQLRPVTDLKFYVDIIQHEC